MTTVYDKLSPMKMLKLLRADSLGPVFSITNIFSGQKGKTSFCITFKMAAPLWPFPKPNEYLLAWREIQAVIPLLHISRKSQGT